MILTANDVAHFLVCIWWIYSNMKYKKKYFRSLDKQFTSVELNSIQIVVIFIYYFILLFLLLMLLLLLLFLFFYCCCSCFSCCWCYNCCWSPCFCFVVLFLVGVIAVLVVVFDVCLFLHFFPCFSCCCSLSEILYAFS